MIENLSHCPVCNNQQTRDILTCRDYLVSGFPFTIRECSHCLTRFTSPRPDKTVIGEYYESTSYISHDTTKKDFLTYIYRIIRWYNVRKKYQILERFSRGNTILDIGCGTGEFIGYCAVRKKQCTGIEPNPKARTTAGQNYGVNIFESLETLPGNETYDIITLWHVLEHFHDPRETLNKLRPMLAPGGIIVAALPNCRSYDAEKFREYWAAYDVPRHLFHFSAESFKHLYTNIGFLCIAVLPQYIDAFYISFLSEKNMKRKFPLIHGFFTGFISNVKSTFNEKNTSSLIFILTPK
jgi:SAM-dependent methyltransferase